MLIPANAVTVINPAAMPAGTKLFLGYVNSGRVHTLNPRLIYANSYTCAGVAPGGPRPRLAHDKMSAPESGTCDPAVAH